MDNLIKIIDPQTLEVLYTYSLEESEQAYQKAQQLEELGLAIKLEIPTFGETLAHSLGLSAEKTLIYLASVHEE